MNIDKWPRWILVAGFTGFMLIAGFMLKGAFRDLDFTKDLSLKHDLLIPRLMEDISSIKLNNEIFRREYREDRKEDLKSMQEMKREILIAVKNT